MAIARSNRKLKYVILFIKKKITFTFCGFIIKLDFYVCHFFLLFHYFCFSFIFDRMRYLCGPN